MDYTISFDASLKVKKGQEKGYINHLARDVFDKENGYSLQHSNENINSKLTNENQTFVNNGNGTFKDMESINEAIDYLDERLSTVKRNLRKDAVIARPLIFQLDSEYIKTHSKDDIANSFNSMLGWAANEFGIDNLVCGSIHMDETNPHMHLMFTPVTEDGRLAQKDWFKNPATLKKQHNDFRKHMQNNGYNATNERVTGCRKGLPIDEYKMFMSMSDKITEIVDRELELVDKEMALKDRFRDLSKRSGDLSKGKIDLVKRKRALKDRETDLDERTKDIDTLASEIKLKGKEEAQSIIDEARKRAEAIEEHAKMEAKRLRAGAKAMGRETDKIANNANEMTQRDKRLRGLQSQYGHLMGQ